MVYRNNIAAAYLGLGKYEECVEQCKKAIEIGRSNRADFKAKPRSAARPTRNAPCINSSLPA